MKKIIIIALSSILCIGIIYGIVHVFHPKVGSVIQDKVNSNLRNKNKTSSKQATTAASVNKRLTNKAQDEIDQAEKLVN